MMTVSPVGFKDFDVFASSSPFWEALAGADDGELFVENCGHSALVFEDKIMKEASQGVAQGFGLRAVFGAATVYAHSPELSCSALRRAAQSMGRARGKEVSGVYKLPLSATPLSFGKPGEVLEASPLEKRVAVLKDMDMFIRDINSHVCHVSFHITQGWQDVAIYTQRAETFCDRRDCAVLGMAVTLEKNGRRERAFHRLGGRFGLEELLKPVRWEAAIREMLRQGLVALEAVPAPAGEMPVILGCGSPGIMLHEAVGHGLEADFNRKELSAFSHKIGQKVAASGVTVVDDGTLDRAHGTQRVDDEGTPCQKTVLIEDGILRGYLQDRLNSRLMNTVPTGNGRRESYAHLPMPRMTNTYMEPGQMTLNDMLTQVGRGVYAVDFNSGQVDIVSGDFVFCASEAYLIENGALTVPLKGVTFTGNGPQTMKNITAVGNDLQIGERPGYCGKNGQTVMVGVGQPSILVSRMTVGGTAQS